MNTIAFKLGPCIFHWYGLILVLAILLGLGVSIWVARLHRMTVNTVAELLLCCVPAGLIAARLYYVAANWHLYAKSPVEILYIWHGGLAVHGAFAGLVTAVYFYTRLRGLAVWTLLDVIAPGISLTHAVGQWGNFINQEAFGYPTSAAWGIYIDYANRPNGFEQYDYFHPTFLYEFGFEIIICLILIVLNIMQVKFKRPAQGSIFLLYMILYSIGRIFIESFRIDSEFIYGVRLAQAACILTITIAIWLMAARNKLY